MYIYMYNITFCNHHHNIDESYTLIFVHVARKCLGIIYHMKLPDSVHNVHYDKRNLDNY